MKRLMVGIALLAMVVGSSPAAAAGGKRVETFEYTGFGMVDAGGLGVWFGPICIGGPDGCVTAATQYKTSARERAVAVKIVDDQGFTVRGVLVQEDGVRKAFCGSSGRVPIEGGKPLTLSISANPCGSTPSGAPTTGTVTTTFIRR